MKDDTEGIAYDSGSSSVIKLNNGMVLYLREVNKYVGGCSHSQGRNSLMMFEHQRKRRCRGQGREILSNMFILCCW